MHFITWEGPKYVSIHSIDCWCVGQHGGNINRPPYRQYATLAEARSFAKGTGRPVVDHTPNCHLR